VSGGSDAETDTDTVHLELEPGEQETADPEATVEELADLNAPLALRDLPAQDVDGHELTEGDTAAD
jgi:hypothetical protein